MAENDARNGVILVALTYIIWGVFPLFWKMLDHVPSFEVLLNRVLWSFFFTTLFVLAIGKGSKLLADFKSLWRRPIQFWSLVAASFVISLNWFIYIWAVNNDQVLQTSLGYYINPLISVLFGVLFFKEKLDKVTIIAVGIAFVGVATITLYYGEIPLVSLVLALSFATYSVMKKKVQLEATRGLVIETMFMLPFALVAYIYLMGTTETHLFAGNTKTMLLLMVSGIFTAIPLVLFAKGAQKIPLYLVSFVQYLSPTIVLFLGIFLYKEPFTKVEFFAFICIWVAVVLFSFEKMRVARKNKKLRN